MEDIENLPRHEQESVSRRAICHRRETQQSSEAQTDRPGNKITGNERPDQQLDLGGSKDTNSTATVHGSWTGPMVDNTYYCQNPAAGWTGECSQNPLGVRLHECGGE